MKEPTNRSHPNPIRHPVAPSFAATPLDCEIFVFVCMCVHVRACCVCVCVIEYVCVCVYVYIFLDPSFSEICLVGGMFVFVCM